MSLGERATTLATEGSSQNDLPSLFAAGRRQAQLDGAAKKKEQKAQEDALKALVVVDGWPPNQGTIVGKTVSYNMEEADMTYLLERERASILCFSNELNNKQQKEFWIVVAVSCVQILSLAPEKKLSPDPQLSFKLLASFFQDK